MGILFLAEKGWVIFNSETALLNVQSRSTCNAFMHHQGAVALNAPG